jgi:hypothetical protein
MQIESHLGTHYPDGTFIFGDFPQFFCSSDAQPMALRYFYHRFNLMVAALSKESDELKRRMDFSIFL